MYGAPTKGGSRSPVEANPTSASPDLTNRQPVFSGVSGPVVGSSSSVTVAEALGGFELEIDAGFSNTSVVASAIGFRSGVRRVSSATFVFESKTPVSGRVLSR